MTLGEVRSKEELVGMQEKILKEWNKDLKHRTIPQWVAIAYTQHTLDYVLGKLDEPPVLNLIRVGKK